jgi:hypothetical protein
VASSAGRLGVSDENAANAGKLVGAASIAANAYSNSQKRDATYRLAVSDQKRKLEDKWKTTWPVSRQPVRNSLRDTGGAQEKRGSMVFRAPRSQT